MRAGARRRGKRDASVRAGRAGRQGRAERAACARGGRGRVGMREIPVGLGAYASARPPAPPSFSALLVAVPVCIRKL